MTTPSDWSRFGFARRFRHVADHTFSGQDLTRFYKVHGSFGQTEFDSMGGQFSFSNEAGLLRRIAELLPIRDRGTLLQGLARIWRGELSVSTVGVWAKESESDRLLVGIDSTSGVMDPFETAFPAGTLCDGESLVSVVQQQVGWNAFGDRDPQFSHWNAGSVNAGLIISADRDNIPERESVIPECESVHIKERRDSLTVMSCALLRQSWNAENDDRASRTAERNNDFGKRKLESLAEFAAGAGHEINNPLATIAGRVQLLLRKETDPEKRRALETIGGQAYRIRDMIGDVMLFARPPLPVPKTLDLVEIVRSVRDRLDSEADSRGCRIEIDADPPIPVWADDVQIHIVVSQLIRNSLEALSDEGLVSVRCRSGSNEGCEVAEITVTDNGVGLSPTDREHLFDPFYSGRQAGRGLGFGLSKCWRIVSNHGGRIEVDSQTDGTTTFRVTWPATVGATAVGAAAAAALPADRVG